LQFDRAESGASGQTAVTEDDIRRFMFPDVEMERLEDLVGELKRKRIQIHEQIEELKSRETTAWEEFNGHLADLL
jgi:hypothetical protein